MPDDDGNFKGIAVPRIPWHEDCPRAPITDGARDSADHVWISDWQSTIERCVHCGLRRPRPLEDLDPIE